MPPHWPINGFKLWYKIFSVSHLKMMSILMQAKVGSSCPPLCRGKSPWVSSPLLLTCRGGWVGWEPRGGTGAVRPPVSHGCSPWTEMEGSLCPCAHVFFSAALPKEVLAISSPALQDEPSATSRRPSAKHARGCTRGVAREGCKLSCVAACLSFWEGSSGLSPCQKQAPSLVGKALIRTSF